MAFINILDDNTIDKIAAGEVIERPASVVKELVENAIDSGANAISIEIKDGGISYIRVTDNGSGIEKDQIKKAFLRHATSKIKEVNDIFKVLSLGFRGEALSSISAVSQVEVLTKTEDDFSGTRYVISGKREERFEDAGVPKGTTIIVRNLFFNTPARRKFLKSPNTESSYITDLCEKLILSHPEISFKYMINGIDKLVSPGKGSLEDAVYCVYGKDALKGLVSVSYESEFGNIKGFIGKPELARGNRSFELFFVNNRYVSCKVLYKAVEESYKHRLMLHKYPFVILFLDVDPIRLDINVHPAKSEIKFMDEVMLTRFLTDSIDKTLSELENIPQVYASEHVFREAEQKSAVNIISASDNVESVANDVEETEIVKNFSAIVKHPIINSPEPFEIKRKQELNTYLNKNDEVPIKESPKQISLFENEAFLSENAVKKHEIIGQIFDTYWLVAYENNLYIIDQHAAHEKVLYERLIKRLNSKKAASQMISPPEILSLSSKEEDTLKKYESNLSELGFEWEHFGGREYSLNGVPTDLYDLNGRDYFLTVLDNLAEGKSVNIDAVNDRIATMACKAAVKANMHLTNAEARALIDELLGLDNPYNCPHGRPCIITYSKSEIEKLFKRIL